MKKLNQSLPLLLAGLLPFMPLLRSVLPAVQSAAGPTWAYVFPWLAGGLAYFGYDAISSASSISISPPSATNGVFYSGVVTYSGGHAGSVSSMSLSNASYTGFYGSCLASGSLTLAPGLTITYTRGNTATVSGTPNIPLTTSFTNLPFRLIAYESSGCSTKGNVDAARTTSLLIQPAGLAQTAPTIAVQPQNAIAQIGSTVILSGGAIGNPAPAYFWKQGITFIPGATNNSLVLTNVQITNAGLYQLVASNKVASTPASCYLTVCQTPGSNNLVLNFTNFYPAGNALTLATTLTNVGTAVNTYQWGFNQSTSGLPTTSAWTLPASQVTPANSGNYFIVFNSSIGTNILVNQQQYNSYWSFGYVPGFTNSLASLSTAIGATATLSAAVTGNTPTVFWYQNATNLVATQTLGFNPQTAAANLAATNVSLTFTSLAASNTGTYTLVVTNQWGSITSAPALLTIAGPVLAVSAPTGQTNYAGNSVSLSVTASGTAPLSYQWRKGSASLANGGSLAGVATTNLIIAPAVLSDSGNYSVVVTNTAGSVTSGIAPVVVVAVPRVTATLNGVNPMLTSTGGIPNRTYIVQVATNLAAPTAWLPLQTNVASPGGAVSFTDTNNPGLKQRFYQLKFP